MRLTFVDAGVDVAQARNELAQMVDDARQAAGLTQAQLAARIGTGQRVDAA